MTKTSFFFFAAFLLLGIAGTSKAQQRTDFVFENTAVKAGESATGFLEVPKGGDEGTQIPVSIFRGAKEGRILLISAGVHGAEYSPILALQRIRALIDAKQLSGTVILVHVANPPAFFSRSVYYGADGKNLNRVFPGKADGTVTERIAYALTEKLIRRCDYYIDVHSGDNNESLLPYVVYYESEKASRELIETSRKMALATGIEYVKIARERATEFNQATFTTNTALLLGKAAIAIESGELGRPREEVVKRSERGLLNVMRELKMLPGDAVRFKNQIFVTRDQTVRSTANGLFYSLVAKNQEVKENELLGYVTDFFGNRVQEVRAPFAGIVMYFTATPPVSAGEPLVNLGEIQSRKN